MSSTAAIVLVVVGLSLALVLRRVVGRAFTVVAGGRG